MMRRLLLVSAAALCACGKAPYPDIVGPYSGVTYRFVVDRLTLPMQRSDFADDLNGDGRPDNQLGNVVGFLAGQNDLTDAVDDLLGSGVLAPVIELTTDDPALRNDPTVGVRFIGRDGEAADQMGGALVDGALASNPTRLTTHPAAATIHLPLFEHADPLALPATGLEVELAADDTGFACTLRGAFVGTSDLEPAWTGMAQMLAANPQEFWFLLPTMDSNRDGVVTFDEFAHNGFTENLTAPDLQLTDGHGHWSPRPRPDLGGRDSLSFAVSLHLVPCPSGSCHAPAADTCRDRALDGDETDVDCGGGCLACPGGARCHADADCQSRQCMAGACAAPSCSDGVQDGGETGVDCGYGCGPCALGGGCREDRDCTTGYCADVCRATMCADGVRDNDESDVDCGGHCPRCVSGRSCQDDSDCASGSCTHSCTASGTCTGVCS